MRDDRVALSQQKHRARVLRRSTRDKLTFCGLAACLVDRNLHGLSGRRMRLLCALVKTESAGLEKARRPPRQADKAPFSGDFWRLDLVPSAHGERSSRTEARAPCEFLSLLPCTWWVREDALVELLDIVLPVQSLWDRLLSLARTHMSACMLLQVWMFSCMVSPPAWSTPAPSFHCCLHVWILQMTVTSASLHMPLPLGSQTAQQ